ncbi:unnamed protein product [Hydatigera taeniaeformis]|uniref:Expressed conserved protein n=1 Tax=Hydatigena taeniaeformis TaxID=6205 RepID=A0A0R3XC44_HYDTA|nr:unnamed protein product [Hydatigera taeniaeformis]
MSRRDHQVGHIVLALIAVILFFTAIGYSGWDCRGSILGKACVKNSVNLTAGALLTTAGVVIFFAVIFLILKVAKGKDWMDILAIVLTVIAAILAMAGVFYYLNSKQMWSPFIATIAMSLNVALAAILTFDHCTINVHKA